MIILHLDTNGLLAGSTQISEDNHDHDKLIVMDLLALRSPTSISLEGKPMAPWRWWNHWG